MAIRVVVPDFGELYRRIEQPTLDSVILSEELPAPISAVNVSVQSDGRDYSLKARLSCEGVKHPFRAVRHSIAAKFRIGEYDNDYFLVNSATAGRTLPDTQLLGALGQYSVEVLQAQGLLWVLGGAGLMPMGMPRSIKGEVPFRADFNFFTAVLTTAITALYSRAGQVPDLALTVKVDDR